ncbi:apolipoprotein N-acyltransferase [Caenimonas sp. SL110]|uniref:apolipoprotein N-acyltransferase n=1 Tax=Caenimonas sp. SL110 TaxID=1450524 RepID=UPI0009E2CE75|nr:apolipoprotein N-acyltransferase [Caenimonas sp. SL110]
MVQGLAGFYRKRRGLSALRALPAFAIAIGAGLAHAISIAAPWSGQPLWWLQLLSLAAFAWLCFNAPSWKRAALLGWAFGTAWLTCVHWWLFISLHVYGGLASPLAVIAVVGLAAFLSSYYALAGAISAAFAGARRWLNALLFAAAWMLAEFMRVKFFTGFPWGAGGYAHVDGPLAFLAPYVGVHGIGLVAALLAALIATLAARDAVKSWRSWAAVAGATGLIAAGNVVASSRVEPADGPRLSVALLQGNIPQDEKFQGGTGIPTALAWYGRQLVDSTASLVVAPETAIPLLRRQLPDGYFEAVFNRFAQGQQAALVGIPLGGFSEGYTNSVMGFKPGAQPYRYDKHHLVPFGEFIPPLFKWFTQMMNIPLGDFNRGSLTQPNFEWQGQRIAPNICYEDLFGEELGERFSDPATAPTLFVNVSNIGWFGNTVAIDQHLHISRMRSLEFDRAMIRATNTGATVIIDPRGRVTHSLERHTRGVLLGEAEGRTSITPYAAWVSQWGLWPLYALGLIVIAIAFQLRIRTSRPGRD